MTIKQIADQVGVSKTAIRNKIRRLWSDDQLHRENATIVLTEEQVSILLADYEAVEGLKNGTNVGANVGTNVSTNDGATLMETLKQHIDFLQHQLDTKDLQIAHLTEALNNSTRIQGVQAAALQRLGDGTERKSWFKGWFANKGRNKVQ